MAGPVSKLNVSKLSILDGHRPHNFTIPVKKINEGCDVSTFLSSKAYKDIMIFILQMNAALFPQSIPGFHKKSEPETLSFSSTVKNLRNLLNDFQRIIDEVPPDPGPRRFGNISFRRWYERVECQSSALIELHLPPNIFLTSNTLEVGAKSEIKSYLLGSFGSPQRLDYGTGHELNFIAFLGCIWKLGGFENTNSGEEERSIVLGVVEPYLQLIRRLIKTYTLEPAGSHGVWGLDDHSFIPYVFGSAQYAPAITSDGEIPTEGSGPDTPDPADVAKAMTVERERNKNMYFGAIGFIYDVKKGPFWEHSPMLYDISGIRKGWAKINKGMIKMYNAEVLSKFPVVQHFKFGSLFSWDQDPDAIPPPTSVHTSNQPSNKGVNPSSENTTSMRGHPQQATKAPWATKEPALPNPSTGTPAPWASKPSDPGRISARLPLRSPDQFPKQVTFQPTPASHQPLSAQKPGSQQMMPPPRAPQARPGSPAI